MKQLVIHIGARKTASTAIQKFLFTNNDSLRTLGCHYIQAARMDNEEGWISFYAHHRAAQVEKFGSSQWNEINKEIESEDQINKFIVSSELFYSLPLKDIQLIREYTKDLDVKIVFVIRDRMDFLVSEYKQQIKISLEDRGFKDFTAEHIALSDFKNHAENWMAAFGKDNLKIIDYDKTKKNKLNIINVFCEELGIGEIANNDYRQNVSLTDDQCVTLRRINSIYNKLGQRPDQLIQVKRSIKSSRRYGKVIHGLFSFFNHNNLIPSSEYKEVMSLLRD